jgi:hypothetical protein
MAVIFTGALPGIREYHLDLLAQLAEWIDDRRHRDPPAADGAGEVLDDADA